MLTPSGFKSTQPRFSPMPLKSHPGLALSVHPPAVPPAGASSPVIVAAARGFSRSAAGLPWTTSAQSIRPPPGPGGQIVNGERWSPFRSEYSSRFAPHADGLERVLNHQRLVLEGGPRIFRLPVVEQPTIREPFGLNGAFQSSPRGQYVDRAGCGWLRAFS